MKSRLLFSAIVAGLVLQPASAETRKGAVAPVPQKQAAKSSPAPVSPAKKSAVTAGPAPDSKPTAAVKKKFGLKALFSRKPAAASPAPPPPKAVAVTVKKTPPPKAKATNTKPVPVIRRNTGEFINISYPEPQTKKASVTATNQARS